MDYSPEPHFTEIVYTLDFAIYNLIPRAHSGQYAMNNSSARRDLPGSDPAKNPVSGSSTQPDQTPKSSGVPANKATLPESTSSSSASKESDRAASEQASSMQKLNPNAENSGVDPNASAAAGKAKTPKVLKSFGDPVTLAQDKSTATPSSTAGPINKNLSNFGTENAAKIVNQQSTNSAQPSAAIDTNSVRNQTSGPEQSKQKPPQPIKVPGLTPFELETPPPEPEEVEPNLPLWSRIETGFAKLGQRLMFWKKNRSEDQPQNYNSFGRSFSATCTNPACKLRVKSSPEQADKMFKCPACNNKFYVPSIGIECPNEKCRSFGLVTADRVNSQLICDDCKTEFYIEQGGRGLTLGKYTGKYIDPLEIKRPTKHKPDIPERILTWWGKLDPEVRSRASLGIKSVLGLLICYGIWLKFMAPGPNIPNSLDGRVSYVVKAITSSDFDNISNLLDSKGTKAEVAQWVSKVRPASWPKKLTGWKTDVLSTNRNSKAAVFRVTFTGPSPNIPPPPEPQEETTEVQEQDTQEVVEGEETTLAETEQNPEPDPVPDPDSDSSPANPPAPVVQAPRHVIMIYLKNGGDDNGGWRLDMTECLRAVGIGGPS